LGSSPVKTKSHNPEKENRMQKIRISNHAFLYPMPMVLVGTLVEDRPNFMAVGWVSRVNFKPPMIGAAIHRMHYTNQGIRTCGAFSVNVPAVELMEKVDYCGLVSGRSEDKSLLFSVSRGEVTGSPMVDECPLSMECRVIRTVELPTNDIFIGEIVGAYCGEKYLTEGKPDIRKMDPFTLTMPDNTYWKVGDRAGGAWNIGKNIRKPPAG
jgi:flavin reductase (DIM6/NTAB) family NADH-FMN oxidoreductase RutF